MTKTKALTVLERILAPSRPVSKMTNLLKAMSMELPHEVETDGGMHDKLTYWPLVNNKERTEAWDACERSNAEKEPKLALRASADDDDVEGFCEYAVNRKKKEHKKKSRI